VSAAPDSPWRQRVADVVAKKARLGVDSWGSRDTGVRHIMTPIEETFAREYPGFDPFPFGQASWLMTLVRSIVLAEPMLDDFERAFAGITDPATVAAHGVAFLHGMAGAGVATSAKHFPGLGRVRGNTDFTASVVDSSTTASAADLQTYQAAIDARYLWHEFGDVHLLLP